LLLPPLDALLLVAVRRVDARLVVERPDFERELAARLLVERLPVDRDAVVRRLVVREELDRPLLEPEAPFASCFCACSKSF
jgi:hypothetical protein